MSGLKESITALMIAGSFFIQSHGAFATDRTNTSDTSNSGEETELSPSKQRDADFAELKGTCDEIDIPKKEEKSNLSSSDIQSLKSLKVNCLGSANRATLEAVTLATP